MNHSNANLLGVISPISKQLYSEANVLKETIERVTKTDWRKKDPIEEAQYKPAKGINIKEASFNDKLVAGEVITRMFAKEKKRLRRN